MDYSVCILKLLFQSPSLNAIWFVHNTTHLFFLIRTDYMFFQVYPDSVDCLADPHIKRHVITSIENFFIDCFGIDANAEPVYYMEDEGDDEQMNEDIAAELKGQQNIQCENNENNSTRVIMKKICIRFAKAPASINALGTVRQRKCEELCMNTQRQNEKTNKDFNARKMNTPSGMDEHMNPFCQNSVLLYIQSGRANEIISYVDQLMQYVIYVYINHML